MLRRKVHQIMSDAGGVVAGDSGFFEVVTENGNDAQRFHLVEIVDDLAGGFESVFRFQTVRDGRAGDQRVMEDRFLCMAVERANVSGVSQSEVVVGLGHEVADVDLGGSGLNNGLTDSSNQQIRNEAGET